MKKPELLAPAGEPSGLAGAIAAGADAVYLGGRRFSARAYAGNFSDEELLDGLKLAHIHGRRIYLALNTLIKEREFDDVAGWVKPFYEAGLDGVIVQDPGVFLLLRTCFPDLRLHVSTQAAVTGGYSARALFKAGASRIVPARELSLRELVNIKRMTDAGDGGVEIEAFIHGAMCYSYSGMCLMSAMLGGRSGNRGRCAGACRLPYETEGMKGYPLSLRDMCTLPILQQLIVSEVIDSFKIEGRMKDPVYTAGVTAVYRRAIDAICEDPETPWKPTEEDLATLRGLYLRTDLCDGYYFRHNGPAMVTGATPGYVGADERITKNVREQYLERRPQVPVNVRLTAETGKPLKLELKAADRDAAVCLDGAAVERAEKQPTGEEKLRAQLDRFGESAFVPVTCEVTVSADAFVPASVLNGLRRRTCDLLEEMLQEKYTKRAESREMRMPAQRADRKRAEEMPPVSVLVETPEQLVCALRSNLSWDRVYLPSAAFFAGADDPWMPALETLGVSGEKQVFAALPHVLREEQDNCAETDVRQILSGRTPSGPPVNGVLVRNIEEGAILRDASYDGIAEADQMIPLWNGTALSWWTGGTGPVTYDAWTLSPELNVHEIGELLDAAQTEARASLVIYGRVPMMISAGCVRRTAGRCSGSGTRSGFTTYLRDRKGKKLPVSGYCRTCYNVICNAVPTCLFSQLERVRRAGVGRFRLDFTTESGPETEEILKQLSEVLAGAPPRAGSRETTTGRFLHGVE